MEHYLSCASVHLIIYPLDFHSIQRYRRHRGDINNVIKKPLDAEESRLREPLLSSTQLQGKWQETQTELWEITL